MRTIIDAVMFQVEKKATFPAEATKLSVSILIYVSYYEFISQDSAIEVLLKILMLFLNF